MMNIADAEVCVTTRFSQESGSNDYNWFRIGDYSSLAEFYIDCTSWFSEEETPEYLYPAWDNIPGNLIREDWICPHIFEIRHILTELGDRKAAAFLDWCKLFGWDIASEDPRKILYEYEYADSSPAPADDINDPDWISKCEYEDIFDGYDGDYMDEDYLILGHSPGIFEFFDENYD